MSAWQATQSGQNPETLDQQLEALQAQLTALQSKYTDDHPDVIKAKSDIAVLKQKIAESDQRKSAAAPDKNAHPKSEPTQILQLRAQIHQYDQVIKERTAQQEALKKQIEIYQERVAASPGVEQEYKLLTRDHQTVLDSYNDAAEKAGCLRDVAAIRSEPSRTTVSTCWIPRIIPSEPSFPKLPMFAGGGFGAGLALGLGLSLLLEMHDTSMRSEHDVEVVLRLARSRDDSGDRAEYGQNSNERRAPRGSA